MKYMLFGLLLIILISCKTTTGVVGEVVIDCTGSYVRIDNKDYRVCNKEVLEGYKQEDKVLVRMKRIDNCSSGEIVCMMYLAYEYQVKVQFVRKADD